MATSQKNMVQLAPEEMIDIPNIDQLYKGRLLDQIYEKEQPRPGPEQQEKDYLEAMNDDKMFRTFMSNTYESMKRRENRLMTSYNGLVGRYNGLLQEYLRTKHELNAQTPLESMDHELREQVRITQQRNEELVQDHERMKAIIDRLMESPRSSPIEREERSRPKTKSIPHPDEFSDGKKLKFEEWHLRMVDKLEGNADHFEDEQAKIRYIRSRLTGDAYTHVYRRSRGGLDNLNPFRTAEDVFNHLANIYQDVNRLSNARAKFDQLRMGGKEEFQAFLSKFNYLAQESELAESEWKSRLWSKLTVELQKASIPSYSSLAVDFYAFCKDVSQTANALSQVAYNEGLRFGRGRQTIGSGGAVGTRTISSENTLNGARQGTPAPARSRQGTPVPAGAISLTEADRMEYRRTGKCFSCGDLGHIAKECPKKKQSNPLSLIEEQQLGNEEP